MMHIFWVNMNRVTMILSVESWCCFRTDLLCLGSHVVRIPPLSVRKRVCMMSVSASVSLHLMCISLPPQYSSAMSSSKDLSQCSCAPSASGLYIANNFCRYAVLRFDPSRLKVMTMNDCGWTCPSFCGCYNDVGCRQGWCDTFPRAAVP